MDTPYIKPVLYASERKPAQRLQFSRSDLQESAFAQLSMCYSAQIRAEYKQFVRLFGGELSLRAFSKLYFERQSDPKIKIPKGMDALFDQPQSDEERQIKLWIDAFNAEQATKFEQELFKQRKRLPTKQKVGCLEIDPTGKR
ncbi:hypothetical protein VAR608DRAFT_5549 [Variovorax sp. HW608]|uniref:hypothetical protein n=1 Tax=Variovorax sp. HW608 TaxID=1034889 RepID=UPI000820191D|nr:hypothetical protein [Variovorax sp. HW608]SCK54369.1 hypothetical protein VAR608DRAFT_5549 [Variovorax sp. HW608]